MKTRQKLYDRLASTVIRLGGAGLILMVVGIFVFMVAQTLPLFFGAAVHQRALLHLKEQGPVSPIVFLGLDEWGERPFVIDEQGQIFVYDITQPKAAPKRFHPFADEAQLTPRAWDEVHQTLLLTSEIGELALLEFQWSRRFDAGKSQVELHLQKTPLPSLDSALSAPYTLQMGEDSAWIFAQANNPDASPHLLGLQLSKEESFLDEGHWELSETVELPLLAGQTLQYLKLNPDQDTLLLGFSQGQVQYWQAQGATFRQQSGFYPFGENSNETMTSMDFLHGGGALYVSAASGKNHVLSLLIPPGEEKRQWVKIQELPALPQNTSHNKSLTAFAKSQRNRAFLVGRGAEVRLAYSTTGALRWQQDFTAPISAVALSEKYHRIALLETTNKLFIFDLDDPHPEGGLKAFFGKLWYEGGEKPAYQWQSTGGSDAFEPKLSVVPLIIGTLKGTFYSLLFAVPLALLAALYTSEFLHPRWKHLLKPLMEIMASLPSVILGFLAALWLAPHLEHAIPALILMIVGFPLVSLLAAWLAQQMGERLPSPWQKKLPPKFKEKYEWMWLTPVLLVTAVMAWYGGPWLESVLFRVNDPTTGESFGNFASWWRSLGLDFEMRSAVVVGIVMGFAVIPLIFTLAEEAFAAVPKGLRAASLALGASPWQTALRVVLPTAAVGVFSAIMIGLGRAVGETMIVLMATGNTPLLDFNPFTGMRTLSANLAVELPEAPFQGTLYRTLFLGAVLLFVFTFGINSIAEILRERIRKKSGDR